MFAGFSIGRVRECLHLGKTSIFSNLLEEEASMVRWHSNGLDLTRFHDFGGIILTSSPYPLQLIKGEEFSWRKLALVSLELWSFC